MSADNPTDLKVSADSSHLAQLRAEFPDYDTLMEEARQAQEAEHSLSIMQAFRKYPKAIGWSVIISLAIVMEGYDLTLMSSFFAQPAFQRYYGVPTPDTESGYTITAAWQAGLQNGVQVGSIFGLAAGGYASDKIGYRWTMIISLVALVGFIFIPVFAHNIQTLLAGQILMGLPFGVFQSLASAYASEVVPARIRHVLVAYVNLCWVMGQVIASGVLRGALDIDSQWAYRMPFMIQWVWPIPVIIGCIFAPDSPWWQVRHGKYDLARNTIRRLNRNISAKEVDAQLALMAYTNAMEKAMSEGTQYWDCFKGVDLRRTEVACVTWLIQNATGSAFIGWSTYFLQQAGLATSMAFTMTIIQYAIGALGTISSWFLLAYIGRKTLFLTGLVMGTVFLVTIGGLGFISDGNTGASWAIGGLLLAYAVTYQATTGPVTYVIVAEVSSTRLRAKTIVLARITYNIWGIINNIIMPQFLNPDQLNWGGRTGLFWGGLSAISIVWTYFRQPEMKGRTYGELDRLFERRISARKFPQTQVHQFRSAESGEVGQETIVDGAQEKHKMDGQTGKTERWIENESPAGQA